MQSSVTLSDIAVLPLPARAARVIELGGAEMNAALAAAAPAHAAIGIDRLAWALAFNLETILRPPKDRMKVPRLHARPDTPWPVYWAAMNVRLREGENTSLLGELARSVACEHRGDWQPPDTTIRVDRAEAAFSDIYARLERAILAHARTRPMDGEDPESIASMAWSSMFRTYWQEAAAKRFVALCAIRTMLTLICNRLAYETQRRHNARSEKIPIDDPAFDETLLHPTTPALPDPFAEGRRGQLRRCIAALPGRQAVFAQMVWIEGRTQVETARLCGTTAPNVHQTLDRALKNLKSCMAPAGASARRRLTVPPARDEVRDDIPDDQRIQ
jgi:RNA polymerase sigma factor (sigma-70 family)